MSAIQHYTVTHPALTPAARTGSGQSSALDFFEFAEGIALVDVTAIDPGASLVIKVETSPDQSRWWELGTMPAIITVGKQSLSLANLGRYIRATYSVTGGSATFGVDVVGKT